MKETCKIDLFGRIYYQGSFTSYGKKKRLEKESDDSVDKPTPVHSVEPMKCTRSGITDIRNVMGFTARIRYI